MKSLPFETDCCWFPASRLTDLHPLFLKNLLLKPPQVFDLFPRSASPFADHVTQIAIAVMGNLKLHAGSHFSPLFCGRLSGLFSSSKHFQRDSQSSEWIVRGCKGQSSALDTLIWSHGS